MAGRIPQNFVDDLMTRVDIVDVIDKRVPLTRKGREYQACCPFHDEKTPSFTVSPSKQFYHCFGCGAHGTAIGFLIDYANLSFVEAVEELADGVGMDVPREQGAGPANRDAAESPARLLGIVEQAGFWFQKQLREHEGGRQAIAYLKRRGLDGRTAAAFGIGYAPDSWDGILNALGKTTDSQDQLLKTGLLIRRDQNESGKRQFYDRFRGRVIFPIEDHRGRVVAFGGRILGDGEPKYLNSPETPLFHKGAELYGLHRARREIGAQKRSIVVEGYMDVVSLAQFGVENSVATLGTATTRTHLQRLFRLAPEIVFCFDGDRAGRDAAWKAMQVALPEMQDGRQVGFLFLPDGEDPDTVVRSEGKDAFQDRIADALPLPDFLFETLTQQVDMSRMEGKARLVSLVRPMIEQLPEGVLQQMMWGRLSSLSGLNEQQISIGSEPSPKPTTQRNRSKSTPLQPGQLSNMATATSLLLQTPALYASKDPAIDLGSLTIKGSGVLQKLSVMLESDASFTTARLLESFRDEPVHPYLEKLASHPNSVEDELLPRVFNDTLSRLVAEELEVRRMVLIEKSRQQELDDHEKQELVTLLSERSKHEVEN
ncbi:MAG: DNA primase [Pseudomonadota bacterium]